MNNLHMGKKHEQRKNVKMIILFGECDSYD